MSLKLNNQIENSELDDSSKMKEKKEKTSRAEDLINFQLTKTSIDNLKDYINSCH